MGTDLPEEPLLSGDDLPEEAPPPQAEAPAHPVEQTPEPRHPAAPPVDEKMLQRIRDDAYAEGLSTGKAITQSEREAELAAQFTQLQELTVSLGSEQVFDMDVVARSIEDAVLTLASERIGVALTDMPEPLLLRLDTLLDNLAHLLGTREVFVCPEDVPLLQKCLDTHPNPPLIYLRGDPTMQRGDARLRVGGAEVSDLLRDRATSLLRKTGADLV
ncbi:FliH/SctL family protein [Yoonia sp. TsM2_T14_4]|uniref:FliH/SctL family protein n=1 Tax=Yoonia sp. TsM2_T14_4 TaxID=3415141 RepID=UPI003C716FAE